MVINVSLWPPYVGKTVFIRVDYFGIFLGIVASHNILLRETLSVIHYITCRYH